MTAVVAERARLVSPQWRWRAAAASTVSDNSETHFDSGCSAKDVASGIQGFWRTHRILQPIILQKGNQ